MDNLHIHSTCSGCASREMTLRNIILKAEEAGLKKIAITDHVDRTNTSTAKTAEELLKRRITVGTFLDILLGVETTQLSECGFALPDEYFKAFDIVLIASNHYHRQDVEQPKTLTPKKWAEHHIKFMSSALPRMRIGIDAFAHPFLLHKKPELDHTAVLKAYDWKEIDRLIEAGATFEINPRRINGYEWFFCELILHGARWIRGTDAHTLVDLY